ncbi:MAG: M1 family metallopeptidase [Bacteroidales bacterium]|nr:M1 family metallopeptidase [Bacteroidales bacterium]
MAQNWKKYSGIKLLILSLFLGLTVRAQIPDSYFQQEVHTKIHVSLDDSTHSLHGEIFISYKNNSPDSLSNIWFHLYPNAYKNQGTALAEQKREMQQSDFYFSNASERGYIDSLQFTVNDEDALLIPHEAHIDIAKLRLNKPLLPGEKIEIYSPFYVKIPETFSRFGHSGQAYYISQWYPKPAVYDASGWHAFPYLDIGEFYSEYGDYEVIIDVPANYKVAASGQLQTKSERSWLAKLPDSKSMEFPKSDSVRKQLKFTAENIHDFAWFADKRFCVRHERYGNDKEIWTYFLPDSKTSWENSINYLRRSMDFFTAEIGELPYPSITAIQGNLGVGGGMEYPGITLIGHEARGSGLELIIMHEVGHNWFYGALGFNERVFPWMDEGLVSFYENKYMEKHYPSQHANYGMKPLASKTWEKSEAHFESEFQYNLLKSLGLSRPANLHSEAYDMLSYYILSYKKPVAAFYHLQAAVGEEKLKAIMQDFYSLWKNKHPNPDVFREFLETESGQDLSWFFDGFIGSTDYADYTIRNYKNDSIILANKGNINPPLILKIRDSIAKIDGFSEKQSIYYPGLTKGDSIIIDPEFQMLEQNRMNNTYQIGSFSKKSPIKLRFLAGINDFDRHNIYVSPVPAFNGVDGFMPGILISNSFLPVKSLEFRLMPLYAVKTNRFTGTGRIDIRHWTEKSEWLKGIQFSSYAKRFSLNEDLAYHKLEQNLRLMFRTGSYNQKLSLETRFISTSVAGFAPKHYQQIEVKLTELKPPYPFEISITVEHGKAYFKTWLEAFAHIPYTQRLGLDLRLFAGHLHYYDFENHPNNINFRLSGTHTSNDYLFEMNAINRAATMNSPELLGARQMTPNQGGFVLYSPISSNNQMLSFSLSSSTFVKFLRVYANFAAFPGLYESDFYDSNLLFDSGIELQIIPDVFEIYFPILASESIQQINESIYSENYFQRIGFRLSLDLINPWDLRFKPELLF